MGGYLVISLDFELLWGVFEKRTIDSYGANILGARTAIGDLLDIFVQYDIKCTWAIVGFLFAATKEELLNYIPPVKPEYSNRNLSSYDHLDTVGINEIEDPYHFAATLIPLISVTPGQEIATHTFSHYFCLAKGQTLEAFDHDLAAARKIANAKGIKPTSLIFPRNEVNQDYLSLLSKYQINCYRSIREWQPRQIKMRRLLRLIDSYIPLWGHDDYPIQAIGNHEPYNVMGSRFLRPYSTKLRLLDRLKLWRILRDMTHAARHGRIYHLWWHPHNFGVNQQENFKMLRTILDHYKRLQQQYGFSSTNMSGLVEVRHGKTEVNKPE